MNTPPKPASRNRGAWLLSVARLLLPLMMLWTLSAATHAQTTSGTTGSGFVYWCTNDQVTITAYTGTGGVVIVPGTINVSGTDQSVNAIGVGAFQNCTSLSSVTIPTGVTSIGDNAFFGCSNLKSVDIPTGVTSIGSAAFSNCTSLTDITIPNTVTVTGSSSFYDCTNLATVTLSNNITSIGDETFTRCSKLASVNIPYGVTSLGYAAFYGCISLTNVSIPNSVTSLGIGVFDQCSSLGGITLPNSITSIGDHAFYSCTKLTSIVIPTGVTSLGIGTFYNCQNLSSVTLPDSFTTIGDWVFVSCPALISVTIPSKVTSIGNESFNGCIRLKSAVFMGNAPSAAVGIFSDTASDFTAYYFNNSAGFGSPTWTTTSGDQYPAVNLGVPTPIPLWLLSNGFAYNANLQSAPNGDGVSLLAAYAFKLDSTRNLSRSLPRPVFTKNNISLTYYAGSDGVTYFAESSSDLKNWSMTGVTLSGPDANKNYTATVPVTGVKCFMRLRLVYVPQ